MKGDIAEILIYDAALSSADRSSLTAYLASKYGIALVQVTNGLPAVVLSAPTNGVAFTIPTNITLKATATDPDGSVVELMSPAR